MLWTDVGDATRRRRRWRPRCSVLLVCVNVRLRLVLCKVALDEASMLFNLVFSDAHRFEILQYSLYSGIAQINAMRWNSILTEALCWCCMHIHTSRRNDTLSRSG